ncbi:hypothetical protein IW262DRAFT_1299790 [Armillaria fumosa]|nr:hypothetical protein IW262DRAFT_1299790 [Armillaria fumosa]
MVDATSSTQAGWELVLKFAQSDWTLPHVEQELMTLLRDDYDAAYWRKPLKAVMDAEGNVAEAVSAVTLLMPSDFEDHPSQSLQPLSDQDQFASCSSLKDAENECLEAVKALKSHHCIKGDLISLDDLLDPLAEQEDADLEELNNFADGDKGLHQMIDYVRKQLDVEKAGDEEEEEEAEPEVYSIDFGKALLAAALLEEICANHGDLDSSFELSKLNKNSLKNQIYVIWNNRHMEYCFLGNWQYSI